MSSSEGLEILRAWQRTDATVVVSSSGPKKGASLFEVGARIASVDTSELVLSEIGSGRVERLNIDAVEFSKTTLACALALHLRFPDGKTTLLTEKLT